MKKKFFTSIAVTFVMAAALVAVAPTNAQAAKAINVKVGEKTTVKASKKVTWSIKDTSIATLNKKSGKKVKLTGVKEGSTILTTTDASGKKLDYAVNVKAAAAPAPTAANKLQEFANYVKSKNGLTYKGKVDAWNNWEIKNNNAWGWVFGHKAILDDNQQYQLVYRYGTKEGDHKASDVYTITADTNNIYFTLVRSFDELDVRYISKNTAHDATDKKNASWATKGLKNIDGDAMDKPFYFNTDRYYIYGTVRNIDNFKVTIPLNGNAATATFAHNTDYDFFKGDSFTFGTNGKSTVGAVYSEWDYQFAIGAYLTNAAYSWTLAKDGHDYLENSFKFFNMGTSNLYTKDLKDKVYANMSVLLSYQLNNLLNTIDSILKDNATGYDLKSIGFTNFVNGNGHYFTNADQALAALYSVAWENIAFY